VTTATAEAIDLAELDLGDPRHWETEPPYALFARMRREAPVHWSPLRQYPEEGGFWSITRAEDMATVTRDFETFSSERRGIFIMDDVGVPLDVQCQQMISMDPPRHDRLKKIVGRAFTPKRIAEHEDAIRAIVERVLDRFEDQNECDLVTDIARPIPARVIGSLLGTPEEDDPKLVHWTNVATAFEDPGIRAGWDDSMQEVADAVEYIVAAKNDRVESPRDDLLTALIEAEIEGDHLNDLEIAVFFVLLLAAGNDSTRATYCATMLELMRNPEQRALLLKDPSLIPNAVEEGLRCFPAFAFMGRAAQRDVELHGQTIKEGDRVLLWYIAANRDEERFTDPERFDVTRENVEEHQAFGAGGRHFCLGAALARLELRVWIEETLRRFPEMELAGEPTRVRALFLNQYFSIPVRLRPF
jgi:cytochrome P450